MVKKHLTGSDGQQFYLLKDSGSGVFLWTFLKFLRTYTLQNIYERLLLYLGADFDRHGVSVRNLPWDHVYHKSSCARLNPNIDDKQKKSFHIRLKKLTKLDLSKQYGSATCLSLWPTDSMQKQPETAERYYWEQWNYKPLAAQRFKNAK